MSGGLWRRGANLRKKLNRSTPKTPTNTRTLNPKPYTLEAATPLRVQSLVFFAGSFEGWG